MPPSISELKNTPSFCFPFKIPDDPTTTTVYVVVPDGGTSILDKLQKVVCCSLSSKFVHLYIKILISFRFISFFNFTHFNIDLNRGFSSGWLNLRWKEPICMWLKQAKLLSKPPCIWVCKMIHRYVNLIRGHFYIA